MIEELFKEALHELKVKPIVTAVEFIQFGILVGIIRYFVLPKVVGTKLKERKERIVAELERAAGAEEEYAGAQRDAQAAIEEAKKEALELVRAAQEDIARVRETSIAQAEEEASNIVLIANQGIENEKTKVVAEASDQLIGLVTVATRRFMDEAMAESERRALTHRIIVASLEGIENVPLQSGEK